MFPPSKRAAGLPPSLLRKIFNARRPTSINLGLGEPWMPVADELFEAGVARYRQSRPGYTLNAGMPELRERILSVYGLPHTRTVNNVVVTVGGMGALFAILMAVGDPGDEIVVPDPSFAYYRAVAELLGLRVVAVPLRREAGFALDVEAIAAAIGPRTRAVLLNSPCNPTGRIDREDELRALVGATERSGVWLVSDEIYREVHYGDALPPSIGALTDRAVVFGALSKSCSMMGFRLGYLLAPDALASAIAAVHQYNVTCAPSLSQLLALEAFEHPEWLGHNRPQFARQRKALVESVDRRLGLPYCPPEGAFYLFVDFRSTGLDSLTLTERLLAEADVVTVPGIAFGPGGEGFLRLSYGGKEELLDEGVLRIARFVEGLRR